MGSCGVAPYSSNVFYLYDADSKTLTIKGNGAIRDYASAAEAPWSSCDVEKITIDGGITRIGEYAFANLLKIKQEDVTIAQGVEVADSAFAKVDSSGRMPLPQSEDLYYNAYIGDTTIAAKMSKDGVVTIYPTDTSKDTKVPGIDGYQGDNTAFPWYESYGKTFTKDYTGVHASEIKEIVFANGLTEIGGYLFNSMTNMPRSNIKIHIPDSVTKVGGAIIGTRNYGSTIAVGSQMNEVGFWYASSANSVYLLNPNMTGIPFAGQDATRNIAYATTGADISMHVTENSAAYATLTKEGTTYTNVITHTDMGACGVAPYSTEAFWTYDEDSKTLTVLGSGAIRDYASAADAPWSGFEVETLLVEPDITTIGANAFASLKTLQTVHVADSVSAVAETAFATGADGKIDAGLANTTFLTGSDAMKEWLEKHGANVLPSSGEVDGYKWSVSGDVLTIEVKGAASTDELDKKTAVISSVIAGSEPAWTAYKSMITTVKIGYGVTEIGENVFADMPVLASVKLPSTLTKIGAEAFDNTPRLTKLYLPKKTSNIANSAFGTSASAAKSLTIQISPVAPASQKSIASQGTTTITVDDTKNLNVLLIGNSYFGMLSGYMRDIARGLGKSDTMVANYYFGGNSGNLQAYAQRIANGTIGTYNPKTDSFSGYKENGTRNDAYNSNPLSMGIEAEDWDYVVMETWGKDEPAGSNGDSKLSQDPNLMTLKNYITKYAPQAEVSLYHVCSCRYLAETVAPAETLTEEWKRYVDGADDGLNDIVAHVIPASTLIQNARLTYLNADGEELQRDPPNDITHLNYEADYINAIMMYEMLTGTSTAAFKHGSYDSRRVAFHHQLVDATRAAGMKQLTYAFVEHDGNTTYYDSLAAAANAAVSGDTLTLLAMPKSETELAIAGGVTVKTFGSQEDHSIVLTNGGRITATGLVAFTGCAVDGNNAETKTVAVDPATGEITSQESSEANVYVYAKTVAGNKQITNAKGVTYNKSGWLNLGKLVSKTQLPLVAGTKIDSKSELFSAVVAELDTEQFTEFSKNTHVGIDAVSWDDLFCTRSNHDGYAGQTDDDGDDGWSIGYHLDGTLSAYSVTFDANANGDATDLDEDLSGYYVKNATVTVPTNLTREGYTFLGWTCADMDGHTGGDFRVPAKDVTLKATWEKQAEDPTEAPDLTEKDVIVKCRVTPDGHYAVHYKLLDVENGYTVDADQPVQAEDGTWTYTIELNPAPFIDAYTNEYGKIHSIVPDNTVELTWTWALVNDVWQWTYLDKALYTIRLGHLNEYTVNFDANGGKGQMEDQNFLYSIEQALSKNEFSKTGYSFTGWNTDKSGNGIAYADEEKVLNLTAENGGTVTLYAQWAVNKYKVTFDANGGETVSETKTLGYGSKYGNLPTTTREGYTFLGWFTAAEGGQQVGVDVKTVKIADDHVLYAHWKANTYMVFFEANGGEGTMEPQTFIYDETQNLARNLFVRNGYAFLGWNTASDGSGADYADEQEVKNLHTDDSIVLYAQWKATTYTVAYHGNGGKLSGKPEMDKTTSPGTIGQALKLKNAETFVREHYDFVGWATDPDATEAEYKGSQILTDGYPGAEAGKTYDLYAVWKKHVYTVSINACLGGEHLGWITNVGVTVEENLLDAVNNALNEVRDGWTQNVLTKWETGRTDIAGYHADRENLYRDKAPTAFDDLSFDGKTTQVYVNYLPNPDTHYKVEHYQEQLDGSTYALAETENLTGTTDTEATATDKGYTGFAVDKTVEGTLASGTIAGDGSLVLKLYYKRNSYTVSFDPVEVGATAISPVTVKYQQCVADVVFNGQSLIPSLAGYTFRGWYDAENYAKEDGTPYTFDTKVMGSIILYAKWEKAKEVTITHRLTINYVYENGTTAAESKVLDLVSGESYSVSSPSVSGYLADKPVVNGTMPDHDLTETVVYTRRQIPSGGISVVGTPLTFSTKEHFAYVNGYPNGTVKPTGNVTRAEVAAILCRIMDADCAKAYYDTTSSYRDVARGDWFNVYVATLENAGVIVDTRAGGYFRPNEAITRAELASMLAQFAENKKAANYFTDVPSYYWAANAIAVCAKTGWINGYPDGTFRPDQTVTRAEMMAMINRALERTPKSAADLLAEMKVWSDNANVNAWYYLDVQEATDGHTYTKSGTHETWKKLAN